MKAIHVLPPLDLVAHEETEDCVCGVCIVPAVDHRGTRISIVFHPSLLKFDEVFS